MRAIGVPSAGAFEQLGPVNVEPMAAGEGQVEVRVHASAVNPADLKVLRGEFAGRVLHARTKPLVSGYDFSGVVERDAGDLRAGDEVYGFLAYSSRNRQGAFAERVVADRATIARKPASVSHETAAAAATPGLTALQALRDLGRLPKAGRALVLGAAGGVGSLAVGVARALGARVSGVCSTYAVDLVRELGAEEVIDRRARDPRTLEGPFDVVFDAAAAYSYAAMRDLLAPAGAYVTTLPSPAWAAGKLMTALSRRRCHVLVVKAVSADLEQLATWIAAGMRVPIDSRFPVRELAQGLARLDAGEVRGRIAIDVAGGW
ncbi:MAG: NAD(P)-dependent alcohol dehydrogenase [Acidobacteriota bacterium]